LRNEQLTTTSNHEQMFADFVAKAWSDLGFVHEYCNKKPKYVFSCKSLKEARDKYLWGGSNWEKTDETLRNYSSRLKDHLSRNENSHALHHLCLEILEWGRVEGVSSAWLRVSCDNNSLRQKINRATEILASAGDSNEFKCFDGSDLVMNSGVTKIYSLASPDKVAIYDSRVGAALGFLTRKYLEGLDPKQNVVPDCLCFPWGVGQTSSSYGENRRNPSLGSYKFGVLRSGGNGDQHHAYWCWRASKTLNQVVNCINSSESSNKVLIRDIEAALFMIGCDVKGVI
jgi:hypothetical protein